MIGKITKGSSFLGVLQYAMDEKKGRFIETNLSTFSGVTPENFAKQLNAYRELNERVKKPVFHVAIALEKDAKVNDEVFKEIGTKYMEKFGFNAPGNGLTPYVMIRHTDTDNPHIHIIASRIDTQGHCHNPGNDYKLSNQICRELEKEYSFQIVPAMASNVKNMQKEEIEMRKRFKQEGKRDINYRKVLQTKIDKAMATVGGGKRPFKSFINELKKEKVKVDFNTDKNVTRINGISFSMNTKNGPIKYKGSAIGKGYTWNSIKEKIDFNESRDIAILKEYKQSISSVSSIDMYKNWDNQDNQEQAINKLDNNKVNVMDEMPGKLAEKGSHGAYQEEPTKKTRKKRRL